MGQIIWYLATIHLRRGSITHNDGNITSGIRLATTVYRLIGKSNTSVTLFAGSSRQRDGKQFGICFQIIQILVYIDTGGSSIGHLQTTSNLYFRIRVTSSRYRRYWELERVRIGLWIRIIYLRGRSQRRALDAGWDLLGNGVPVGITAVATFVSLQRYLQSNLQPIQQSFTGLI